MKKPAASGRVVDQLAAFEEAGGHGTLDLPTGALRVSNLDKVFYPATQRTKGDLMRYYARLSEQLLPAIADRALVMKRFPNGIDGKAFYQHRAPESPPASVRVELVTDDGLTPQERLVGGDLATLLYLPQLGAISIDPWHSRVESMEFADYTILDLDPGPRADFQRVVDVAHVVKDVLDRLDLHAVPKTSGARGVHVVVPLPPRVPNDGARMIAEIVATMVVERAPKLATIERAVAARPGNAIYVDFLQNIRGKTVAGVYSARAVPDACVSMPLGWDELTSELDPRDFTIDTAPARVAQVGDLWAKAMRTSNSLEGVLAHG